MLVILYMFDGGESGNLLGGMVHLQFISGGPEENSSLIQVIIFH